MPKGHILAVDDQRYFRELLDGILTEEGFEVQTASGGEEALRILEHSVFDVVVTDLVMPVMSGSDLVQRVKERWPEQEIIVVTGVVDVKSAVEAMKLGATDYLLKPFDRETLSASLQTILERNRVRSERDRLLDENIEFMSERSLLQRAVGLFTALSLEPLAQAILEGLWHETGAQGGLLWLAGDNTPDTLRLFAVRGLVRPEEERERLEGTELPARLRSGGATTLLTHWNDGSGAPRPALLVALRRGPRLAALIRLTDKLGGDEFDDLDRACAERFAQFAETALGNVDRFRALEQRTLQNPKTGAYRLEYLQDVVRNEIEKANRFGRSFGVLQIGVSPLDALRKQVDEVAYDRWLSALTHFLGGLLRSTDLLASDTKRDGAFWVLVAESDAIGTATFKQRVRGALEQSEALASVKESLRPKVHIGAATFPGDATQIEAMQRVIDVRIREDRRAVARNKELDAMSLAECLQRMLDSSEGESPETVASLVRFALSEIGRRPRERNLFFFHPSAVLENVLRDGLDRRREGTSGTEIVILAEPPTSVVGDEEVAWIPPGRVPGCPPFLVHFGDGPSYALVCGDKAQGDGLRLFHTSDRALVEYLAFRLQRELHVPRLS
ncbi:MAG: response regulator [Myxococcales bacterium]|nr:response regulator [Myxococcales bacterium]